MSNIVDCSYVDSRTEAVRAFLSQYVIVNPEAVCDCGLFCHGEGHLDTRIVLTGSRLVLADALNRYGAAEIDRQLDAMRCPYRLQIHTGRVTHLGKMTEAEARQENASHKAYFATAEGEVIAYGEVFEFGDPTTEYETTQVRDVVGYDTEWYDEPVYKTVTKYKTEQYVDTVDKWGWESTPITKKKTTTMYVYNSWSKKVEPRSYDEFYPDSKSEFRLKTEKVQKTRQVPYEEKVQDGTRRTSRQIPVYGMVDRAVQVRYYKPSLTSTSITFGPREPIGKHISQRETMHVTRFPASAGGGVSTTYDSEEISSGCSCSFCNNGHPSDVVSGDWAPTFTDQLFSGSSTAQWPSISRTRCLVCGAEHHINQAEFCANNGKIALSLALAGLSPPPWPVKPNFPSGIIRYDRDKYVNLFMRCFGRFEGTQRRKKCYQNVDAHDCCCYYCIRNKTTSCICRVFKSDRAIIEGGIGLIKQQTSYCGLLQCLHFGDSRKFIDEVVKRLV